MILICYWIEHDYYVNFYQIYGLWKVSFQTIEVGWINYANKGVCGSILSVFVKRSIEYSITLIMELFCAF